MTRIARRVAALVESATLAITERAKQMRAAGVDVVSFGAGEPDWDTPDHVKEAGIEAIRGGKTKYTASSGLLELREAIAAKLARENGLTYAPTQVLVTTGAKQAIFNVVLTLCEEGDEVLVPSPYWVSYPVMVTASGARAGRSPSRAASRRGCTSGTSRRRRSRTRCSSARVASPRATSSRGVRRARGASGASRPPPRPSSTRS